MLPTAVKVALRVFSRVLVEPAEELYASWTPASWRRRLTAGEATIPVPRGAGISYRNSLVVVLDREVSRMTYANSDGTALSTLLRGQRVRVTKSGTPVSTTNRKHTELCNDDSSADSSSHFL